MKYLNILIFISTLFLNACTLSDNDDNDKGTTSAAASIYINDRLVENNKYYLSTGNDVNTDYNFILKIKNTGNDTLQISSIKFSNSWLDGFTFTNNEETGINIEQNDEETINIGFNGTAANTVYEAEIIMSSNASNAPVYNIHIQSQTNP